MEIIEPRLYIIMREELYDMNPGKAMAQAAHAQAEFMYKYLKEHVTTPPISTLTAANYNKWVEDRCFGTTIVLSATQENMFKIFDEAHLYNFEYGPVLDPTYPYKNFYGQIFTAKELTCGWVFVPPVNRNDDGYDFYNQLKLLSKLHP